MAWLSPSYPVGAFSYSSGIEWAVDAGDIKIVKIGSKSLVADSNIREFIAARLGKAA